MIFLPMRTARSGETLVSRIVDRFFGNTPLASLRRIEALKQQPVEIQFTLSHVFIRELIEQFEAYSRMENLEETLVQLCQHQLEVFVREELGMPLHPGYFMELNQERWQAGEISLHDSYYLNKDNMLERSRKGTLTASNESQQRRYQGETDQIDALQQQVHLQLEAAELVEVPESDLLEVIHRRYPESFRAFSLGNKLMHTMPKSEVHKGDKAYINTLQAFYLPHESEGVFSLAEMKERLRTGTYSGKVITITDALFYDLKNQELAQLHGRYHQEKVVSSEEALLRVISELPEEFRNTRGREYFLTVANDFLKDQSQRETYSLLVHQQSREVHYNNVSSMIHEGSRFLAQVLLLELARATESDSDFLNFPTRLYYAFGLVASPLLQRLESPHRSDIRFSYARARNNYLQTHPVSVSDTWREKSLPLGLKEHVSSEGFLRNVKKIQLTTQEKQHYNQSLQSLGGFYLNNVASNALCNAFSFGNFASSPELLNMGLTQNILSGMPVTNLQHVKDILGNAEGWKMGSCINPSCPNPGIHQMVGPCSICMSCQLRFDVEEYQKYMQTDPNASDFRPGMQKAFSGVFNTMDDLRNMYGQYLNPSLVLPVMMMGLPMDVALQPEFAGQRR